MNSSIRKTFFIFLGCLLILGIWQVASIFTESIAISSPMETLKALIHLSGTPDFYKHFFISLERVLIGILIGGLIGFILGIFAGLFEDIRNLLEPIRWVAMSIPPVTVLVVVMLWLGMGTKMVVSMAAFLLAPVIYVNTVAGMQLVDKNLINLAKVYRFSFRSKLTYLYIPALAAPLIAGMVQIVCSGIRVVVLAEVMGSVDGIGAVVAESGNSLDTPVLFAWVLVCVLLVAFFQYLILSPVEKCLLKWKRN